MAATGQPSRVLLVRHGATDWSEAGRHTGWTDIPLNQRGEAQAGSLAPALAGWTFSQVLVSPLQRAVATYRRTGLAGGFDVDPDLREWHYGDYEGLTSAQIRERRPGWVLWDDGVSGGETLDQVAERADRVIGRLQRLSGDVAIVAHGHLLRVLATRWIGQPARLAQHLMLSTATLSVLGWEHEWPVITLWNEAGHLPAAGGE